MELRKSHDVSGLQAFIIIGKSRLDKAAREVGFFLNFHQAEIGRSVGFAILVAPRAVTAEEDCSSLVQVIQ
jgi:hypothetical protein